VKRKVKTSTMSC